MTSRIPITTAAAAAIALILTACSKEKTCAPDQALCGGTCTAVQQDPANCGACGHSCPAGEACSAGTCTDCSSACGAGNHCTNGTCVADLYLACFNTNDVRGVTADLQAAGVPIATDAGPIALTPSGGKLYAANSISNSLTEIAFGTAAPATRRIDVFSRASGFADLEYAAAHDGVVYVSNASVNTLVAIDPARGVIDELPLGATADAFVNPQGIDFVGDTAYVALNGTDELAVVDVSTVKGCLPPDPNAPACDAAAGAAACSAPLTCVAGRCQRAMCAKIVRRISLASLTEQGARASPQRVKAVGTRVYVSLANLTPAFQPAGDGKLAVVDTAAGATAQPASLDLGPDCLDPGALDAAGDTLYVACGHYDYATSATRGGGIARVSIGGAAPALLGVVPTGPAAPVSLAICGGKTYAGDKASGTIFRYDPASGDLTSADRCPAGSFGSYVADVECAPAIP